ncbi:hypothetical protein EXIGLDRAFT_663804 [Exidia glandulosa HHB12029]|uniref:RRM domain-containing protein n=1 Tax=Exidia glandulosa HHB12029 TaxID=1314781 RepID=A0A165QZV0_EXIGL|nr:hypothetical protein EXIGLDRAFT_663804 [Exidia glandulosa HHB12029]
MPSSATSSAASSSSSSDSEQRHAAGSKRKRPVDDDASSSSDSDSASEHGDDSDNEVEVLSHAAQRKRKKQLAKAVDESAPDSVPPKVSVSSRPATDTLAKRQNSVWVGNLSFRTTPAQLRTFFDGVGEITRVHMPMKLPAKAGDVSDVKRMGKQRLDNRGFAYVDFATPDSKQIAIAMSEGELDGRKLLIKDGDDFTGRPAPPAAPAGVQPAGANAGQGHSKTAQKILASQKQPPAATLFFGNLGFEATPESIKEMLDAHAAQAQPKATSKAIGADVSVSEDATTGESAKAAKAGIRKVRLGTFEDSGLCKGFGFVDFHTTEQATAVLINPRNHHLDGRKLVVEYASADAVRRGGGGGPRRPRENSGVKSGKRAADTDGQGPAKRARIDKEDEDAEDDEAAAVPPQRRGKSRPGKIERMQAKGLAPPAPTRPTVAPKEKVKPQRRPNPGAALANAQRGSAAIVPPQGQKIVF